MCKYFPRCWEFENTVRKGFIDIIHMPRKNPSVKRESSYKKWS